MECLLRVWGLCVECLKGACATFFPMADLLSQDGNDKVPVPRRT